MYKTRSYTTTRSYKKQLSVGVIFGYLSFSEEQFTDMSALDTLSGLMGQHIVDQSGQAVKWSSLTGTGKFLGLYFSAHWCPPCRSFTPKLVAFYKELKSKRSDFDIIFISSDRDEASFNDYFKDMPWLALKYDQRDAKVGSWLIRSKSC